MPNLSDFVSGPSVATVPAGTTPAGTELELSAFDEPHPDRADVAAAPVAARNVRRVKLACAQREGGSGDRSIQSSLCEAA